jgi:hypothetical protein
MLVMLGACSMLIWRIFVLHPILQAESLAIIMAALKRMQLAHALRFWTRAVHYRQY